jgi:hypothetical protein
MTTKNKEELISSLKELREELSVQKESKLRTIELVRKISKVINSESRLKKDIFTEMREEKFFKKVSGLLDSTVNSI